MKASKKDREKHKKDETEFATKNELLRTNALARELYHGAKMRLWISLFWNLLNSVALMVVIYLLLN